LLRPLVTKQAVDAGPAPGMTGMDAVHTRFGTSRALAGTGH
jgi:hypothetical protein